jgi:hypothetical protein
MSKIKRGVGDYAYMDTDGTIQLITHMNASGMVDRCESGWESYKRWLNEAFGTPKKNAPAKLPIKNVIFSNPATIVFWLDGSKTVVKCQPGDTFDPEKGLAMAVVKYMCGNQGNYCSQLKKWLPKEEPKSTTKESAEPILYTDSISKAIAEAVNAVFGPKKGASAKTFRQEITEKYPELCSPLFAGGVFGCPRDKKECGLQCADDKQCRACWDRPIPKELMGE